MTNWDTSKIVTVFAAGIAGIVVLIVVAGAVLGQYVSDQAWAFAQIAGGFLFGAGVGIGVGTSRGVALVERAARVVRGGSHDAD